MPTPEIKKKRPGSGLNSFLNEYFPAVVAVLVVVFLAFAYLLFIGPKFRSTRLAIQDNINTQQQLYAEQQRKLANYKAIASLYEKISQDDLAKFGSALPEAYLKERLFGELDDIIGRSGVVITSINISEKKSDDGVPQAEVSAVKEILVEVTIESVDYQGFKSILGDLEESLRLFDVRDVTFSLSGNSAKIILATYYYQFD